MLDGSVNIDDLVDDVTDIDDDADADTGTRAGTEVDELRGDVAINFSDTFGQQSTKGLHKVEMMRELHASDLS